MSDMKLIMESWRGYVNNLENLMNENLSKLEGDDKVYLIRENKQVQETTMTSLLQQCDNKLLSEQKLGDIIVESINYEYNLLVQEGIIDTLKQGAKLVGQKIGDAAAKAQFFAREKLYKVLYGTASKILRFISSLGKKALNTLTSYVKQIAPFAKTPPKPGVAQKLIARTTKIAKSIGAVLKRVASFLLKVIKPIGKFLGNPVVKNTLLVGCVIISGVAIAAPGVLAGSGFAFLAPYASSRIGREAGMAAIGRGQYDLGYDPKTGQRKQKQQKLDEVAPIEISEGLLEMLEDLPPDVLGKAMDKVATEIGDATFDETIRTSTIEAVVGKNGEEVVDVSKRFFYAYSDRALKEQFGALDLLKRAGKGEIRNVIPDQLIRDSTEDLQKWVQRCEAIVKSAVKSAQDHCDADPAACLGAQKFIKDINIANVSVVEGELYTSFEQNMKNAQETYEEIKSSAEAADTRYAVTRGGKAGEMEYYRSGKDTTAPEIKPDAVPKAGGATGTYDKDTFTMRSGRRVRE